jgi:hypothetical protein
VYWFLIKNLQCFQEIFILENASRILQVRIVVSALLVDQTVCSSLAAGFHDELFPSFLEATGSFGFQNKAVNQVRDSLTPRFQKPFKLRIPINPFKEAESIGQRHILATVHFVKTIKSRFRSLITNNGRCFGSSSMSLV